MSLTLTSPAFVCAEQDGVPVTPRTDSTIPARFARIAVPSGRNLSIPYLWDGAPEGTRSFVLALVDIAPIAHDWVHWIVADIPPSSMGLPEGASSAGMPTGALEMRNSFGDRGYGGPQPPRGSGAHPYVATLYALDAEHLVMNPDSPLAGVLGALAGHVLAMATCTGAFGVD